MQMAAVASVISKSNRSSQKTPMCRRGRGIAQAPGSGSTRTEIGRTERPVRCGFDVETLMLFSFLSSNPSLTRYAKLNTKHSAHNIQINQQVDLSHVWLSDFWCVDISGKMLLFIWN